MFAYDKQSDKVLKNMKPENVAAETSFYDLEQKGQSISLDPSITKLDSEAAAIVNRIREAEDLSLLSEEELAILALFVAVQYLRVEHRRNVLRDLSEQLHAKIEDFAEKINAHVDFRPFSKNKAKEMSLEMLVEHSEELANILLNHIWLLVKTEISRPFLISDNPVTFSNEKDFGIYGNIGFAVPGIEIALPISESLSLCFLSKSHKEEIDKTKAKLARNLLLAQSRGQNYLPGQEPRVLQALDGKGTLPVPEGFVLRQNSLQILYAGRWVFSPVNDFSLVRRMIADDPDVRRGPMMSVGGLGTKVQRKHKL